MTSGGQTKKKINVSTLLGQYGVSKDQFEELTEGLHQLCGEVEKTINDTVARLKAGTSTARSKGRATRATVVSSKVPAASSKATTASDQEDASSGDVTASSSKAVVLATDVPFPLAPPPAPVPALEPTSTQTIPVPRSPSKSPTKSAMRAPSVGLTPTKTPTHKRKVAFDGPIPEEDEEEFDALATPSRKRQRLTGPLPALPASAQDQDLSRNSGGAGPSTPRRTRTQPAQPSSTHSSRSVRSHAPGSAPSTPRRRPALPTVMEEGEARRRYRPVFADQQQWLKGDARLERELRPWAEKWRELVKSADGDVWKAAGMAAWAR